MLQTAECSGRASVCSVRCSASPACRATPVAVYLDTSKRHRTPAQVCSSLHTHTAVGGWGVGGSGVTESLFGGSKGGTFIGGGGKRTASQWRAHNQKSNGGLAMGALDVHGGGGAWPLNSPIVTPWGVGGTVCINVPKHFVVFLYVSFFFFFFFEGGGGLFSVVYVRMRVLIIYFFVRTGRNYFWVRSHGILFSSVHVPTKMCRILEVSNCPRH